MSEWNRECRLRHENILRQLTAQATPFEDRSAEAAARRRELPLLEWSRAYLPHYFDKPFAPFHERMVRAAGEQGLPTFVAAFRGAGKSVLLALARPLRQLLSGACPYVIFASQVQKLAAHTMDFLRLELEHNARIRCDYGELRVDGPEDAWVAEVRVVPSQPPASCMVEAFGIGMSPRGRRFRQHRPLEFIGDDLENAELARNPEREQQLWDWLMDEVAPAMEPDRFSFTVLGTMFGPGCMMERARELASRSDAHGRPLARAFIQKATPWPRRRDAGPQRLARAVQRRRPRAHPRHNRAAQLDEEL